MYEAFYGFKEKPFSMLPDPGFLYLSKKHQTALTLLEYGLLNKVGFCVISGEPGAGKTTILRAMLGRVDVDVTVGLITNTHQSFGGLLDWILSVYDLHRPDLTQVEMHQIFMDYLIDEYAKNRSVLLIVDEAQNMNADSLEELRMLSNVNSEKDQLLQVVLVGQPALKDLLRKPELMQFAQRIAVDYHLAPLDLEETCGYIQHRLVTAGAKRNVFTPAACERIYNYSGGTPRLINLLCETVLVFGFADQVDVIDVDLVEEMVHERMRDSVVPIVNKDSVREDNAEAIARLEESFPWIDIGDDEEETEDLSSDDAIETEGESQNILGTSALGDELPGELHAGIENKTDSSEVKTEEIDQVAGVTDSDARNKPVSSQSSESVASGLTGKSIPPETVTQKANVSGTNTQVYTYTAAVVIVALIIIVLVVVLTNKRSVDSVDTEASLLQRETAQKMIEESRLAREAVLKMTLEQAAVKKKLHKELAELEKFKEERAKKDKAAAAAKKKQEKELTKKKQAEKKRAEQKRIAKEKERKAREAEHEKENKKRNAALLEKENRLKAEKEAVRLEQERLVTEKEAQAANIAAREKAAREKAAQENVKAANQSDGWVDGKDNPVKKKSVGCSGATARFKSHCR